MIRPNHSRGRRVREETRLGKPRGLVWGLLVVGWLVVGFLFLDPKGISHYRGMHEELDHLQREAQRLAEMNNSLRYQIHQIKHDPIKLEELARERLGLVRRGEIVYQFIEPDR